MSAESLGYQCFGRITIDKSWDQQREVYLTGCVDMLTAHGAILLTC